MDRRPLECRSDNETEGRDRTAETGRTEKNGVLLWLFAVAALVETAGMAA
ncbi:hypothetical protein E3U43_020889 [Larimichthys crocea]|uniref:Uncharacterized protein n=1 Tax=Larimichthys crocea TaxID=215358 RepID=A0ACD3Q784_LARCR|nr:hypothetical protein E3U43_020889 [Larimichthys crocea]